MVAVSVGVGGATAAQESEVACFVVRCVEQPSLECVPDCRFGVVGVVELYDFVSQVGLVCVAHDDHFDPHH